ncbi:hypothetical protein ACFOY4_10180 [Actinomadura syzygii]|uniref:Uncharacterized protein n=1 Tax=Actinomadura syzygii TaxID=1427538 RepID=A0A5D0UCQ6_9ACTN|nr:hypothetical protein [Actinomadura syzygii]TYC15824.1 hypothetical protein FXF65_10790 [Actinomadura syzygii]
MIHKYYRANGKPDWGRWVMECDSCHTCAYLLGNDNPHWLVSAWPDMNIYCPACFNTWADLIIASALHCPDCQCIDLRIWPCNSDAAPEDQHPGLVDCAYCGAILIIVEPPCWFPLDQDDDQ